MAGTQSARAGQGAGNINDWMSNRIAHLDRISDGAYEAGRRLWSESTRTGGNIAAVRPGDVTALGVSAKRTLSPEMQELRRQQAGFKSVTRQLDRDNRWMAAIALAPIAAVGGLEAVPFAIAREIVSNTPGQPLQLPGRASLLKKGDTYYARYGRRQDKVLAEKLEAKEGGQSQPREVRNGKTLIPDAKLPVRPGKIEKFLEQKPDSPSGRRAAAQALEKYKDLGKVRIIYYRRDPPK